jgi:hypothetical protein
MSETGWEGPNQIQIQAAMKLYAAAAAAMPAVTVVTVADSGGAFTGAAFAATATATVFGVDLPAPALTYFLGTSATGTPLNGAPTDPGTYTLLASYAGNAEYPAASAQTMFTISAPAPAPAIATAAPSTNTTTSPAAASTTAVAPSPQATPTAGTSPTVSAVPPASNDARSVDPQPIHLGYLGTDSFNMKLEEKRRLQRLHYQFTRPTLPYVALEALPHAVKRTTHRKRAA